MDVDKVVNDIVSAIRKFPLVESIPSYGTAGFRCEAERLKGIAVRVGIISCFRSLFQCSKVVGIMITASHNPHNDNGLKLIDPNGDMLDPSWESLLIEFVHCTEYAIKGWLLEKFKCFPQFETPIILMGYDTRESSLSLAVELKSGIEAMHGKCLELGLVTTPQIHYLVKYMNLMKYSFTHIPDLDTVYIKKFVASFCMAMKNCQNDEVLATINLHIDCANGVGTIALTKLKMELEERSSNVNLILHNTNIDKPDLLNHECGADYVKMYMKTPVLRPNVLSSLKSVARWATIDGDADRLLYFRLLEDSSENVQLFDGDRMSCLFASFISKVLNSIIDKPDLSIGVVQTGYANSASTQYLSDVLHISVRCAPTGVKHVHKAAMEFDIGIYFESNGHGTVLFSEKTVDYIQSLAEIHPIRLFYELTNTAIGDAITDLLLVEYVLAWNCWSLDSWADIYKDLPNVQLKLPVKDPNIIKTTDAERRVSNPIELQIGIDKLVEEVDHRVGRKGSSRAFIRPSGTENVVRIFSESITMELAKWLSDKVALLTFELIDGIGEKPMDPGAIPMIG